MPAAPITQAELKRAAQVVRETGAAIIIELGSKKYHVLPKAPDSAQADENQEGNSCDALFGVSD